MTQDEFNRRLILIYKSNNAHMNCNYTMTNVQDMSKFCEDPEAKKDLINMLKRLIKTIENDYPYGE